MIIIIKIKKINSIVLIIFLIKKKFKRSKNKQIFEEEAKNYELSNLFF